MAGDIWSVEDLAIEQLIAKACIEALDVAVLPGAAALDMRRHVLVSVRVAADTRIETDKLLLRAPCRRWQLPGAAELSSA
jgi:hypothetical protein